MREFILFSRTGRTDGNFTSLRHGGRLDTVYQCILLSLFKAHSMRRDVVFHVILNGPPKPPIHLKINAKDLMDVRVDERTWENILRNVLSGKDHPGITVEKRSLQELLKNKENVYVLHEKGQDITQVEFIENPVFLLGDQVGLPRKDESFALRKGQKISLGKKHYLASSCIDIINYWLDRRGL